jgi:hypothetical protein
MCYEQTSGNVRIVTVGGGSDELSHCSSDLVTGFKSPHLSRFSHTYTRVQLWILTTCNQFQGDISREWRDCSVDNTERHSHPPPYAPSQRPCTCLERRVASHVTPSLLQRQYAKGETRLSVEPEWIDPRLPSGPEQERTQALCCKKHFFLRRCMSCIWCTGGDDCGLVLQCDSCQLIVHSECLKFAGFQSLKTRYVGFWNCSSCEPNERKQSKSSKKTKVVVSCRGEPLTLSPICCHSFCTISHRPLVFQIVWL